MRSNWAREKHTPVQAQIHLFSDSKPPHSNHGTLHSLAAPPPVYTTTSQPRSQAVPHPGFNYDTARCQQQMMLEDALESYLPDGGCVMRVRLVDRVEACQAVSRRPIKEEALTMVTGGDRSLRWAGHRCGDCVP